MICVLPGESQLILSARQLMHSCQLYEDCLNTLQQSLVEHKSMITSLSGKSLSAAIMSNVDNQQLTELNQSIHHIEYQVSEDTKLLSEILEQTQAIAATANRNVLRNVFTSVTTGRITKVKNLGNELMIRVQLVTALMMKDVWKVEIVIVHYLQLF